MAVLTKYLRTNLSMSASYSDHSPGVGLEAWGPWGVSYVRRGQGSCTRRSEGVTSNTPTGLYRLALHPSVVLLRPQLLRPAGRSFAIIRPSGLPPVPDSGFPRPRCYRGMTVGEQLPEGSPRIDNGVTHHFGKKLLVSHHVPGVQSPLRPSLVNGWLRACIASICAGAEVPLVPPFLFLGTRRLEPPSRAWSLCLGHGAVKSSPLTTTVFTHPGISTDFSTSVNYPLTRHTHPLPSGGNHA
jgi:hypothetical protein